MAAKKSVRIEFRIAPEFEKRLEVAAEKAGLEVTAYIRSRLKIAMDEECVPQSDPADSE